MPITPQETKDAHKLLWPAQSEFQNRQLYLFQDFLTNTDEERVD
jgi:hypothetical protein